MRCRRPEARPRRRRALRAMARTRSRRTTQWRQPWAAAGSSRRSAAFDAVLAPAEDREVADVGLEPALLGDPAYQLVGDGRLGLGHPSAVAADQVQVVGLVRGMVG